MALAPGETGQIGADPPGSAGDQHDFFCGRCSFACLLGLAERVPGREGVGVEAAVAPDLLPQGDTVAEGTDSSSDTRQMTFSSNSTSSPSA